MRKKRFQPILDDVEGRMSVTEFQQMFETNKYLQKILKLPLDKKIYGAGNTTTIFSIISVIYYDYKGRSWNTFTNRYGIKANLTTLLKEYNISYQAFPRYKE